MSLVELTDREFNYGVVATFYGWWVCVLWLEYPPEGVLQYFNVALAIMWMVIGLCVGVVRVNSRFGIIGVDQ